MVKKEREQNIAVNDIIHSCMQHESNITLVNNVTTSFVIAYI